MLCKVDLFPIAVPGLLPLFYAAEFGEKFFSWRYPMQMTLLTVAFQGAWELVEKWHVKTLMNHL